MDNTIETTYSNIGFRLITDTSDIVKLKDILFNYNNWLNYRKWKIIYSTAGIHTNTRVKHIHYHCVCENKEKPLSNPAQAIRQDFENSKVNLTVSYKEQDLDYKDLYGNKILAISQRHKQVEIIKFLQYPLKEKNPIYDFCIIPPILKLTNMVETANLIYIESKKIIEAKRNKDKKEKEAYSLFVDAMKSHKCYDVRDACRTALEIYRTGEKAIHPDVIMRRAITYCYRTEILSIDQILESNYLTRS